MRPWRLFLASRGTAGFGVTLVSCLLVVLAAGVRVFDVVLDASHLPRFTPVWEVLPVAVATLAPSFAMPRMASWEALAGWRVRWRAALLPIAGTVLPAAIPWVAHYRLPADARWWDICCNVAFFGAIAFLVTPWVGRLSGPLVGLIAYLSVVATQQLESPVARWLPVSGAATNLRAHPWASVALVAAAAGVWAATQGRSRLLTRRERNT